MWYGEMNVAMMIFLALIIGGAAIVALRYALSGPADTPGDEEPETILKRRFAAGELAETEYRSQLLTLRE